MWWDDRHMNGATSAAMLLVVLLTIALVVLLVAATAAWAGRPSAPPSSYPIATRTDPAPPLAAPTPRELLAQRLASGEIDPDDYRARVAALSETGG